MPGKGITKRGRGKQIKGYEQQAWERGCSEAVEVRISELLFADDTTELGDKGELEIGVQVVKDVMGQFEERTNESKEEVVDFGMEAAGGVRMLGCWMGWKEDGEGELDCS